MDEIKLTRIGRYKIAWDRTDTVIHPKEPDQAMSEKLRHLIELGKRLERDKKERK